MTEVTVDRVQSLRHGESKRDTYLCDNYVVTLYYVTRLRENRRGKPRQILRVANNDAVKLLPERGFHEDFNVKPPRIMHY